MNFVFILDTSISMCQTFDGISLFDAAKSAIQLFVYKREIMSQKLKTKIDKYFLITLDEDVNQSIICNWTTSTEHFLYQLKALKLTYDYTNIDSAVQKAFNMLNYVKKIGYEKHIQGRLFSKIQNSFVMIFTDGSPFCTPKKVMNHSMISMIDVSQESSFFKELYRWDQSMYTVVLGSKESCASYKELERYLLFVGGQILFAPTMEALIINIDELAERQSNYNRVYALFRVNSLISQQSEEQLAMKTRSKDSKTNFFFILTSIDYISTTNEAVKDKWPFPDELLINRDIKKIPIKKAISNYILSPAYKTNFEMLPEYYDEYDITDKDFLLKLLSNYPNVSPNQKDKNIYWEVFIDINASNKKIELKPFAVILLRMPSFDDEKQCLFDYFSSKYTAKKTFQLKFLLLPYNYEELNMIISKGEDNVISKPQASILLGKYFSKIPFYYKPYVLSFIKKKNMQYLYDSNDTVDKDIISSELSQEIEALAKMEKDQFKEINRSYNKNKQLHLGKNSSCCKKEYVFKPNSSKDQPLTMSSNSKLKGSSSAVSSSDDYKSFINKCFNISKSMKQQKEENKYQLSQVNQIQQPSVYSAYNVIKKDFNEIEIDSMGDYREYIYKNRPLRDHHCFDEEIKSFIGDIFGNPFKPVKDYYTSMPSLQLANNNQALSKEDLLINSKSEDELSVYPSSLIKKTLRDNSSLASNDKRYLQTASPSLSRSPSCASSTVSSVTEAEEDLIREFNDTPPSMISISRKDNCLSTNHRISYRIDLNDLYDWKINSQMKTIINTRFINCIKGKDDAANLFDYIIQKETIFYSKEQMVKFLMKLFRFFQDIDMDKLLLNKINKKIKAI